MYDITNEPKTFILGAQTVPFGSLIVMKTFTFKFDKRYNDGAPQHMA
jgi:hypothetical protein